MFIFKKCMTIITTQRYNEIGLRQSSIYNLKENRTYYAIPPGDKKNEVPSSDAKNGWHAASCIVIRSADKKDILAIISKFKSN